MDLVFLCRPLEIAEEEALGLDGLEKEDELMFDPSDSLELNSGSIGEVGIDLRFAFLAAVVVIEFDGGGRMAERGRGFVGCC